MWIDFTLLTPTLCNWPFVQPSARCSPLSADKSVLNNSRLAFRWNGPEAPDALTRIGVAPPPVIALLKIIAFVRAL